ncbi:enoyl-CoA hydratase [Variovorax paradoxus]|jgi:enoyl-CoA hydratase/carnithine racemase|uniref:oxepin-CoA hydrolase, alternative type n=1 Tax=Variovorax TaxID=34072 RepID=UPI0006E6B0D6|nr:MULTISPECIES: enoyl-CoA hydratase [unclassified Variovorax]KPU88781.1 enoyl-CoA hydratase [Variovorax paradoxus]KPU91490.1 enoyl-CoA hydratase [Variovorax paradoxus]KPU96370.1 enoyl-CoA hydratase [Variovorax paradoxus]KPV15675.1 enoyl-CoA hydratase [Variovorax paradoxus]KPV23682.1 enoyl-CoA hydratase [Variovorax paradoxus]
MTAELKSTSEGRTMVLTIANPSQRNALGPEIYAAGIEALNGAENSSEIRSVVIVGEGPWFCAGGSLQRLQANRQRERSVQAESIEGLHNWIDSIRTFPKPVIAAVEGPAAGAGFSLALACDFVVAARDAVFAASYSNVALSPDGGLSWHLAQMLPRQLASEWLMNGERIGAERLHALGLVNTLSDPGQALAGALALAAKLNERAPNSLASIKELLSEGRGATLSSQLSQERDHFVRNLHHANAGIGIAAFLEKKKPQYE